jgi:hypothetical protein
MTKVYIFSFLALIGIGLITSNLSSTPNQILKTRLQIIVRNDLGNIVAGAKVQLYGTKADYDASKNPVTDIKLTNDKGSINFDELEKKVYYVNVEKGSANNFNAGVQTDTLKPNRINKVTIVISE